MRAIYGTSFGFPRRNLWLVLGFAALVSAFSLAFPDARTSGASFVATTMFALITQRARLLGTGMKDPLPRGVLGRFALAVLLVWLLPFGLSLALALSGGIAQGPQGVETLVLRVLLCWALLAVLFQCLLGTLLPATASGAPFHIRLALSPARKTAWPLLAGQIRGPASWEMLSLAYTVWKVTVMAKIAPPDGATAHLLGWGIVTAGNLLNLIAVTLNAAVLCAAYRKVEPLPPPDLAS